MKMQKVLDRLEHYTKEDNFPRIAAILALLVALLLALNPVLSHFS